MCRSSFCLLFHLIISKLAFAKRWLIVWLSAGHQQLGHRPASSGADHLVPGPANLGPNDRFCK